MVGGGYSLQPQASSSGGDNSREGQASGLVGNLINIVSGAGNRLTSSADAAATGGGSTAMWIALAAVAAGVVVFFILRKKS